MRALTILIGFLITQLPFSLFAKGNVIGPFELKGKINNLKFEKGEISFEFSGKIIGNRKDKKIAKTNINYSVNDLKIKIKRTFAYEQGYPPKGFKFEDDHKQAKECVNKFSNLQIIIPKPIVYFDQVKPIKINGELGQFYGCFQK